MKIKKINDSGFTLIELLATSVIVLIALGALFVGIQFTEKQITRNYHSRRALLVATAKLEYQFYLKNKKLGYFDFGQPAGYSGNIVLDGAQLYPQNDSRRLNHNVRADVNVSMTQPLPTNAEADGTDLLLKSELSVTVKWKEPADRNMTNNKTKERSVTLVEDYYEIP